MTRDARNSLRTEMRRKRRAVPPGQRSRAASDVAVNAVTSFALRRGARIGAYLAAGAELDTQPLIELACRRGWQVYVPVITDDRGGRMRFAPLRGELRINRHGIAEPRAGARTAWVEPRWLDLVFVPVVAVDGHGNRLGSGAGFYDRAFAYRRTRTAWHKPRLIGLAYELQRVTALSANTWDVPLDGLVTERNVYSYSR